jgi:hypothetical protein
MDGQRVPVRTTKDGRTIRTGRDYTSFRFDLFVSQHGMCIECQRMCSLHAPLEWDNSFHVHHVNGRGMGGSKRDDTFEACKGLCGADHRRQHQ